MTDLAEITSFISNKDLDEIWLAHKPWLRDKTHHYKAYIRWFTTPVQNKYGYREWTWAQAFGSTAEEALSRLKDKVEKRGDR
jgi:hypothetical protein